MDDVVEIQLCDPLGELNEVVPDLEFFHGLAKSFLLLNPLF